MPFRLNKSLVVALALTSGTVLAAGGAQFANVGATYESGAKTPGQTVSAAYGKSKNMSPDQARSLLNRQEKLVKTAKKLEPSLKPDWSAGNWVDQKSGKLVVGVTDKKHAAAVESKRAQTRLVSRSTDDLQALKKSIDGLAKRLDPKEVRWYIDVRRNVVTVEASKKTQNKGKTRIFLDRVRELGPGVKIRTTGDIGSPRMDDGNDITNTDGKVCSIGWWVKDRSGADLIMTAGHCTAGSHKLWYEDGLHIGGTTNSNYGPMDWGTIHVDDIASPRPTTGLNLYDGRAKISGMGKAPVGTEICKSGRTTERTCGPIIAHDVTVKYGDGPELNGMSLAAMHSDDGDSGGPVYQMDPEEDDHVIAQGVLSGGGDGEDPDKDHIIYQPIESALRDGDLIFVTSTD